MKITDRGTGARESVAGFGCALAAVATAPGAEAAVVPITITPSVLSYRSTTSFVSTTNGGAMYTTFRERTVVLSGPSGTGFGEFFVFNDTIGVEIGSNFGTPNPSIPYFRFIGPGEVVQAGTFAFFSNYVETGPGASGTRLIGFETSRGLVGWLRIELGGPGGDLTFLSGAIETMGDSIIAPAVPLPATLPLMALGALALGAAGVRARKTGTRDASGHRPGV